MLSHNEKENRRKIMKNDKKRKFLYIGLAIIFVAVLLAGGLFFWKKKENELVLYHQPLKHDVVDQLYDDVKGNHCTEIPVVKKRTKVEELDQESLLYFIFSHLEEKKELKEKISKDVYLQAVKEVVGDKKVSSSFSSYTYGGYTYKNDTDMITREESPCGTRQYISVLYGYTSNADTVESRVHLGYIEDGYVYDRSGERIGVYEKEKLTALLDHATSQTYIYKKKTGKYYLEELVK